jgi:hypothetical protein
VRQRHEYLWQMRRFEGSLRDGCHFLGKYAFRTALRATRIDVQSLQDVYHGIDLVCGRNG